MSFRRKGAAEITSLLYLIVIIATSFIYITIQGSHFISLAFWVSLAAMFLAETALWRYCLFMIRNMKDVKAFLPGYLSLGVVIAAYLFAVGIYSFGGTYVLSVEWYIVVHILTLVAALIVAGLIILFIRSARNHEQDIQFHTVKLNEIEMALKEIHRKTKSLHLTQMEEIDSLIYRLIEKVRYSDPITPDSLLYLNQQLMNSINTLDIELTGVQSGDHDITYEMMVQYINDVHHRLVARNEQVLQAKS